MAIETEQQRQPKQLLRQADQEALSAARLGFSIAMVPAVGGLLILLGAYWVGGEMWIMPGLLWLLVGGVWTFVMMIVALTGLWRNTRSLQCESIRLWHLWTLGMCAADVVTAFVCLNLGPVFVTSPVVLLTVANQTSVPIERVVVHFANYHSKNDIVVNDLPASGKVQVSRVRPWHNGVLEITVTAGGESLRKVDVPNLTLRAFKDGRFTVYVEEAELPRSARPKHAAASTMPTN